MHSLWHPKWCTCLLFRSYSAIVVKLDLIKNVCLCGNCCPPTLSAEGCLFCFHTSHWLILLSPGFVCTCAVPAGMCFCPERWAAGAVLYPLLSGKHGEMRVGSELNCDQATMKLLASTIYEETCLMYVHSGTQWCSGLFLFI